MTPRTVAYQAPPSMGFSRREYWSGLPLSSPGDLPNPGIEPRSPALQADTLPSESLLKYKSSIFSTKTVYNIYVLAEMHCAYGGFKLLLLFFFFLIYYSFLAIIQNPPMISVFSP